MAIKKDDTPTDFDVVQPQQQSQQQQAINDNNHNSTDMTPPPSATTTTTIIDATNDPVQQRTIIQQLISSHEPLQLGQVWCIIELKWFQSWKRYVHYSSNNNDDDDENEDGSEQKQLPRPGPIDNTPLLPPSSLVTTTTTTTTTTTATTGEDTDGDVEMNQGESSSSTTETNNTSNTSHSPLLSFYQQLQYSQLNHDPFMRMLKSDCIDRIHYDMIPLAAYEHLIQWYGGCGPQISRRTVLDLENKVIIEMNPHIVHLLTNHGVDMVHDSLVPIPVSFSRFMTVQQMVHEAKQLLRIETTDDGEVRLWRAMNGAPYEQVHNGGGGGVEWSEMVLDDFNTRKVGQQYILEVKKNRESGGGGGEWIIQNGDLGSGDMSVAQVSSKTTGLPVMSASSSAASSAVASSAGAAGANDNDNDNDGMGRYSAYSSYSRYGSTYGSGGGMSGRNSNNKSYGFSNEGDGRSSDPGVCGLSNLGNTCFMNSALQCLTKTPQINRYFVNGSYKSEVNRDNPLGMGGKIAEAFGNLMEEMWSGRHSHVTPREFKQKIGKFAPQFSGYQQQDSQELIAYLLDGLHEDLNRILKKPMTEPVASNGRPDDIVADEAWENHKKRNDSIVVDKFQGQLKSTLVCPKCESVSVTFDPYMYLSLPLPVETSRVIEITLYMKDHSPTKYAIKAQKHCLVSEFRQEIATTIGITAPKRIVITEVFHNKIYRYISDKIKLSKILDNDIINVYVLDEAQSETLPDDIHLTYGEYDSAPFVSARMQSRREEISKYSSVPSTRSFVIGAPLVLPFDKQTTRNRDLYDYCLSYVKSFMFQDVAMQNGIDLNATDASVFLPDINYSQKKKLQQQQIESKRYGSSVGVSTDVEESDDMEQEDKDAASTNAELPVAPKTILFTLKFEDAGSYSAYQSDDNDSDVLPYNDDIVKIPRERSYNEKKSLQMYINPEILEKYFDVARMENIEVHSSKFSQNSVQGVTLDDCLERFTTQEKLGEEDAWYCPKCKEFVQATKKFDIWTLPEVLVIHLKRFQYNKYSRDKLDTYVDYPLDNLDLSRYVLSNNQNAKYELFAVSNHYGGLGGGHYTAHAKVLPSGQWYKFDDSYVQECRPDDSKSTAGYVLFYSRKPDNVVGAVSPSSQMDEST